MKKNKINWLDQPSLDYLSLSIQAKKSSMTIESKPDVYILIQRYIFEYFKIKHEDRLKSFWKEIYEKHGVNLLLENSRIVLNFKGEYLFSKKSYYKILYFVRQLEIFFVEWHIKRIDIKKHFAGEQPEVLFKNIKNGYWIKSSGKDCYYQPSLITKKADFKSTACYFKSEHFTMTVYNKSQQIKDIRSKIKAIKKESSQKYYSNLIRQFEFHTKPMSDLSIQRAEVRLINKPECENATSFLKANLTEELFITKILEAFYKKHPLINDKKTESLIYKSFFI